MAHLQAAKWLSSVSIAVLACTPSCAEVQRGDEQREFVRINSMVRAVQAAENADKAAALAALARTSCQRLCEFRATCLAAFERHVEALRELHALEQKLHTPQADPAVIGQDLLLAQHKLKTAQPLINECSRRQGELGQRL